MGSLTNNAEGAEQITETLGAVAHLGVFGFWQCFQKVSKENVTELASRLGVSQSLVSRQLRVPWSSCRPTGRTLRSLHVGSVTLGRTC